MMRQQPQHRIELDTMANTEPLLPRHNSAETPNGISKEPLPTSPEYHYSGGSLHCFYHVIQVVFISLTWSFDAQQIFINVFTDAYPAWHCTGANDTAAACASSDTPCGLPPGSWAWDLPSQSSVISDWALHCSSPALAGLPASAFFAGSFAGGFLFATLADSVIGRKNALSLFCLAMSLSGVLAAAATNLWAYAALRFLCGLARATLSSTALVLLSETAGERWRISGFVFFTFGFLSLPAIAYANHGSSWRSLYLWISVPSLCCSAILHFSIKESPRWLTVRSGPRREANAIKVLWASQWALRRLVATMVAGFGVGMVYIGIPLNAGNLGSNVYISTVLNGLAELPSSLTAFLLISWAERRRAVVGFTSLCAALNAACVLAPAGAWRVATEVAAFFSVCTAFDVLLIYCVELFPTCVRNCAMSLVRQAIVLGGALAPVLVSLGRRWSFVSFVVFGMVVGGCGMAAVCSPETKGRRICDTMEEEEEQMNSTVNRAENDWM